MIEDTGRGGVKLKLKFYKANLDDDDENPMLVIRFMKKQGNIIDQTELMKEISTFLEDVIVYDEEDLS